LETFSSSSFGQISTQKHQRFVDINLRFWGILKPHKVVITKLFSPTFPRPTIPSKKLGIITKLNLIKLGLICQFRSKRFHKIDSSWPST
jgi:hypothetical protein